MTSADVRDMLDLPMDGHHPRSVKKQKTVEKRPEGITRELFALLGERAPPVAITEHVRYKERPKWTHKVQPWERTAFTNPARTDGLVLRHWRRKKQDANAAAGPAAVSSEAMKIDDSTVGADGGTTDQQPETEYYYAKFNVKINGPEYTEEEYENHLTDENWSKAETDYLVALCHEYDLRWIVIADRYEYQPKVSSSSIDEESGNILAPPENRPKQHRSMEDLKARYYTVAAKMMALRQPLSSMSSSEFDTHEKMSKFDTYQETRRKSMAEALLSRSLDDVKEEEVLLAELKRIVNHQDRWVEERKELQARLDSPHSTANIQMYQSSQGLSQLLHTLLAADKSKKRRSLAAPGEGGGGTSPAVGSGPNTGGSQAQQRDQRESISTPTTATTTTTSHHKKGAATQATERRKLTAREMEMYGVAYHDRLTSGVQFRHDKVNKLAQAKSNIQAQRVHNALVELEIPTRLTMPTAKVCVEYEKLIQSIHTLIDARKVSEKVEAEIKVALAQKEERERRERGERMDADADWDGDGDGEEKGERGVASSGMVQADVDVQMVDATTAADASNLDGNEKQQGAGGGVEEGGDEGGGTAAAASSSRPGTAEGTEGARKRSVSQVSGVGSEGSNKRRKK
ncbi:MAG: swr complex subunit [Peltula sp. TS41687]|nr:MAG: swr complex subunit [Peltula sp. TS41687]